mmetsp:Transcript_55401/g.124816  ORF Transcript_55401/g.124816 Transcript_55401/m.124816 type:complete len:333 (+) Transcript_55401:205-1203(+)
MLHKRPPEFLAVGWTQHAIQIPLNVKRILDVDDLVPLSECHPFPGPHSQQRVVRLAEALSRPNGHDPFSPPELLTEEANKAGESDHYLGGLPRHARPVRDRHVVLPSFLSVDPGLLPRSVLEAWESSFDLHVKDHHQGECVGGEVSERCSMHALGLGPTLASLGDLHGAMVDVCVRLEQRSVENWQQVVHRQVTLYVPRAIARPRVDAQFQDRYLDAQHALADAKAVLLQALVQLCERTCCKAAAAYPALQLQALYQTGLGGCHHQVNIGRLIYKPVHGGPKRSHLRAGHSRQGLQHALDGVVNIRWVGHTRQGIVALLTQVLTVWLAGGQG